VQVGAQEGTPRAWDMNQRGMSKRRCSTGRTSGAEASACSSGSIASHSTRSSTSPLRTPATCRQLSSQLWHTCRSGRRSSQHRACAQPNDGTPVPSLYCQTLHLNTV
jgi:hypothetical protein